MRPAVSVGALGRDISFVGNTSNNKNNKNNSSNDNNNNNDDAASATSSSSISISSLDDLEHQHDYLRAVSPLSSDGFNDMLFGESDAVGGDFAVLEGGNIFTDFSACGVNGFGYGALGSGCGGFGIGIGIGGEFNSNFAFDSLVDFDADPSFELANDGFASCSNHVGGISKSNNSDSDSNEKVIKIESTEQDTDILFEPTTSNNNVNNNNKITTETNIENNTPSTPPTHPSLPTASPHETSRVQPGFGASATRCDGQGIAAGN